MWKLSSTGERERERDRKDDIQQRRDKSSISSSFLKSLDDLVLSYHSLNERISEPLSPFIQTIKQTLYILRSVDGIDKNRTATNEAIARKQESKQVIIGGQ